MMKRFWPAPLVAVLALAGAAPTWAQCCKASKQSAMKEVAAKSQSADKATCHADKKARCADKTVARKAGKCDRSKCGDKAQCCAPPKLVYKIGDETTCCAKTAAKLAADHNGKILYLVSDKPFEDKGAAYEAYAAALEAYLEQMTTVKYIVGDRCVNCPKEAEALTKAGQGAVRYCVGGAQFDTLAEAKAAAKRAQEAASKVKMTTLVDGKEYTCPKSAKLASEQCGKQCTFVVGDKCKTECRKTAQVELAKARISAARQALGLESPDEVASKVRP